MTRPSTSPRGERAGTPGAHWNTTLVRTETVIYDPDDTTGQITNTPAEPRPNRATRRSMQRAARRKT